MIKVVFDTNVLISSLFWSGNPRRCILLARRKHILAFTTQPILDELHEKLVARFKYKPNEAKQVIDDIKTYTGVVIHGMALRLIHADPEDNKIVECAVEAEANYIVSGDKHLLNLKKYKDIKIVSPADFLKAFKNQTIM
ncbi:MAG TPA: putative toxin-antitoxin system toxin component, PIN family [Candidatus Brocadiia bacterium]|nr:putative toxin-antitoxin system toxin component, PIN family [Candidatus Brocadiales bacterium]